MPLRDNRAEPAEAPPLWAWFVVLALLGLAAAGLGLIIRSGVDITTILAATIGAVVA